MTRLLALAATSLTLVVATPPMGWNSYNHYNCLPTEDDIKQSAQGIVDLGFADLGYNIVTTDCGWNGRDRDEQGRQQWNATLFPSGGKALGDFIHSLGLKFGLYSGAGYFQCGSTDLPASLGFEEIDSKSFAEWGGDTLKYDNCYSTSKTVMVDSDSAEAKSPERFLKMGRLLKESGRQIDYFLCQWGIGENVPEWATTVGKSWRMSNDIYNGWRSIWRITNQVIPHAKHTREGSYADMDMLTVGLGAMSYDEERFHFGMWSMMKSPLHIGAPINRSLTPQESLDIMANKEVIAINQDPLSEAAQLALRNTEGEWDVWIGNLSGDRKIVGVANWRNESQSVAVDLSFLGIGSADARDVWAASDLGSISGSHQVELKGHELKLLILSNVQNATDTPSSAGYYPVTAAQITSPAALRSCADRGAQECLPVRQKVGNINGDAKVAFGNVTVSAAGKKYVGVDFINYDYAFGTAWGWGTNTRNMTISVNGNPATRWAFPLAGNDWFETGRLTIEVDGFKAGVNEVTFAAQADSGFAPDLVGIEVYE
ncbi:hypothetical protein PpBr36_05103 [Pyricularia pennisetigena]|uniref:hypothetical protein n=1 Tax=Pyricularia pennisetigena TaxID=1578925 RepID=UPI00114D526C|nr:hypothetical protein PpBr36_05103 [Pyricularia pennisetigena]TLS27350.1 hypothetical protein PpBr36_05103 [Pyricularia pennisetigena]